MLPASDPGALGAFLEHPSRPAGTLTYHELQGFLFTVVCAPEMISASEWLPIIFAGEDIDYASVEQAEAVIGQIMTLSNTINAAVRDPPTLLPADCQLRDDVLANFEDAAPIAQWSRGFLLGHEWLEELWEDLPEELEEELDAMLMALGLLLLTRDGRGLPRRGQYRRAILRGDGGRDPPGRADGGRPIRPRGPVDR